MLNRQGPLKRLAGVILTTFPYQVAVITGASQGIGGQLAKDLAKQGVKLGLLSRSQEKLDKLCQEITSAGGECIGVSCDVTSREHLHVAFERVREEYGFIDLLIANAGVSLYCPVTNFSGEVAAQIINTNVLGLLYAIEAVMPQMIKEQRGHIVGISSIASYVSMPVASVYCASKIAVSSQLSGFRAELKKHKVNVTTICPGYIRTEMTAKNKFYMPLLMNVDKASRLIINAIVRKKREYAFPLRMALLAKTVRMMPLSWQENLMGKLRK